MEKFRKDRGTKHKKLGNLWSLEAARASRARPEGGGSHVWPRGGGTYIPYIPSTNSQEGVQSKNFSGGGGGKRELDGILQSTILLLKFMAFLFLITGT